MVRNSRVQILHSIPRTLAHLVRRTLNFIVCSSTRCVLSERASVLLRGLGVGAQQRQAYAFLHLHLNLMLIIIPLLRPTETAVYIAVPPCLVSDLQPVWERGSLGSVSGQGMLQVSSMATLGRQRCTRSAAHVDRVCREGVGACDEAASPSDSSCT